MAKQDIFTLGGSNLNGFLFADIGEEGSGMKLSVLSALARQGLDPWKEAGRLAGLPRLVATDGLAQLIAAMPASPWPMPDATTIAARLVALLPGQEGRAVGLQTIPPLAKVAARLNGRWLIVAAVTVMLLAGIAAYVAPGLAGPAGIPPVTAVPIDPHPSLG